MMIENKKARVALLVLFFGFIFAALAALWFALQASHEYNANSPLGQEQFTTADFTTFSSAEEFKEYIAQTSQLSSGNYSGLGALNEAATTTSAQIESLDTSLGSEVKSTSQTAGRVSTTNVQVDSIDEPDIVKTNGEELFFSPEQYYFFERNILPSTGTAEDILPNPEPEIQMQQTHVIDALPPEELKNIGSIPERGELLLSKDTLAVFAQNEVYGYDITDPTSPQKKWTMKLGDNSNYITARLYDDTMYIITSTYVDRSTPCPFVPASIDSREITIDCTDIYHPVAPLPSDVTYTAMQINPTDGQVKKSFSFVGTMNQTAFYMSPENLYLTYIEYPNPVELMYSFITTDGSEFIPAEVLNKLKKVYHYDISSQSKESEFGIIMEEYLQSLSQEEQDNLENKLKDKMLAFYEQKKRELEKTNIVKATIDDFSIDSTGSVPGTVLNQFSLDEFEDHLRIATTIGQSGRGFGDAESSANDVYILDDSLHITGALKDLGKGERIYAMRFMGKDAYMVTFKETDPFYILDLSNPNNPIQSGELKIPGYSSYLHKLDDDHVVGIGKEDNKMKISLFDVKDAARPQEVSKYTLDEYWSDILNNHHAFLQDPKHSVFFMPAGENGYIVSYEGNTIQEKKKIEGITAKRALFIDDYLYIIGEQKIVVVSEENWEIVKEMPLKQQ